MSWQAYRLVFRLESPLHIGWRRPGNLMQTRYYVPGRVFWGAVTANLAPWLGRTDYRQVGEWVRDNLRFGYFFPADDPDNPLYPTYSQGYISYGRDKNLTETDFERRFLSSLASTAPIEPLVSREWARGQGPGRRVTLFGLGYLPGSVVETDATFAIGRYGIWEQVV